MEKRLTYTLVVRQAVFRPTDEQVNKAASHPGTQKVIVFHGSGVVWACSKARVLPQFINILPDGDSWLCQGLFLELAELSSYEQLK